MSALSIPCLILVRSQTGCCCWETAESKSMPKFEMIAISSWLAITSCFTCPNCNIPDPH